MDINGKSYTNFGYENNATSDNVDHPRISVKSHVTSLKIDRPHYEQEQLNQDLNYSKPKKSVPKTLINNVRQFNGKQIFLRTFPVIQMFSQYSWKNDFLGDLISGCTVAVMHIPQGMGYALLASIPPIVGIYMAFFPVLVYFILGTSRHNSMGTFAVISIMVGKSVLLYSQLNEDTLIPNPVTGEVISRTPMQVATAVCFFVGVIQLVMYFLRLGCISCLLSETLVSGFTTGAAIHVLTSQIKDLVGLTISPFKGYFEVINTYITIFSKFHEFNVAAVVITAITIIILVINNEWLKVKLAKRTSIPFPIELIAIVCGTVCSVFLNLNENYNIKTIGDIPTGLPAPITPDISLFSALLVDSFTVAMVSYTVSVSMALIFAQKFSYEIDFNQELLAMGSGNVVGSFFSCIPISASLSRSTIQVAVGGKTQIASVVSCAILAVVLLWVGPFFEPLPKCVLASVIVVALKGMLMQVTQFYKFLKISYLDAAVWMITFLTVVIVAIDIGLLVGIILSISCIFIRGMKPYTCLLGHVPNTDLYLDINRYKGAEEIPSIKIFHYSGSLNFASRASFKTELCNVLKIDLAKEGRKLSNSIRKESKYEFTDFKYLIVDFSALSYIDSSGAAMIKVLVKEFNNLGVSFYLAGCSSPVYEMFRKCEILKNATETFKTFPTVHDAVHFTMESIKPVYEVSVIRL